MLNISRRLKSLLGKLMLTSLIPLLGLSIVGYIGFRASRELISISALAYNEFIPNSQYLGELIDANSNMSFNMWAAYGSFDDEKNQKMYVQHAKKALETYVTSFEKYQNAPKSDAASSIFLKIAKNHEKYIQASKEIIKNLELNAPDSREVAVKEISHGFWATENKTNRPLFEEILVHYKTQSDHDKNALAKIALDSQKTVIFATLATSLISLSAMFFISLRLTKKVSEATSEIEAMGSEISGAIVQLSSAGQNLSSTSTSTAASLEETVAAIEIVTEMIKSNSNNAEQASSISIESLETVNASEAQMKNLLDSMSSIEDASKKISEIIDVIDDIAFQTNLLALNASVEAARAGEHGKGFAVVAEAVRTLAQRSAHAAKDVGLLIQSSQSKVNIGSSTAHKTGELMSNVVISVRKISALINEITSSTSQQSQSIQQVGIALGQIDNGTQGNAAAAEEISATVDDIAHLSMNMQKRISHLTEYFEGTNQQKEIS